MMSKNLIRNRAHSKKTITTKDQPSVEQGLGSVHGLQTSLDSTHKVPSGSQDKCLSVLAILAEHISFYHKKHTSQTITLVALLILVLVILAVYVELFIGQLALPLYASVPVFYTVAVILAVSLACFWQARFIVQNGTVSTHRLSVFAIMAPLLIPVFLYPWEISTDIEFAKNTWIPVIKNNVALDPAFYTKLQGTFTRFLANSSAAIAKISSLALLKLSTLVGIWTAKAVIGLTNTTTTVLAVGIDVLAIFLQTAARPFAYLYHSTTNFLVYFNSLFFSFIAHSIKRIQSYLSSLLPNGLISSLTLFRVPFTFAANAVCYSIYGAVRSISSQLVLLLLATWDKVGWLADSTNSIIWRALENVGNIVSRSISLLLSARPKSFPYQSLQGPLPLFRNVTTVTTVAYSAAPTETVVLSSFSFLPSLSGKYYGAGPTVENLASVFSHFSGLTGWFRCLFNVVSARTAWTLYLLIFWFKFLKICVHTFTYFLWYRPHQPKKISRYHSKDVTVVIPTVGAMDEEFEECLHSILATNVERIIISTVGPTLEARAQAIANRIDPERIEIVSISGPASKREQVLAATATVETTITALADDHVFWPRTFLWSALIPFEDPNVGHVGTVKRVRRERTTLYSSPDIVNFLACIYLERHNFECTASSAVDGGVFVISGRTCLLLTEVIQDSKFIDGFRNEFWGGQGPLNVDDDNYITRYMYNHKYKVVFHNDIDALMGTSLGIEGWGKFRGQLLRWARTTVRSNLTTLLVDRHVWCMMPWSAVFVYLAALFNYALPTDLLLIGLRLRKGDAGSGREALALAVLLLVVKMIKPMPHYWRNPRDLAYVPVAILFGYVHGFIKAWSLMTCKNIGWRTRKL